MPSLNDAQSAAYKLAVPTIAYNPDAAIAKKWLSLKAQGIFVGVPIGPEIDVGNGHKAQPFSSGAVLVWKGGDTVDVV